MVTYFDEKHCREYGCIYYDPDVILCCKRNFKDPLMAWMPVVNLRRFRMMAFMFC